jgi:thiol:disulfide interchange protein DsbA
MRAALPSTLARPHHRRLGERAVNLPGSPGSTSLSIESGQEMNRRDFALSLAAAAATAAMTAPARAQGEPTEGREFTRLQPPVPVAVAGKIKVVEFFGYWCPHCNNFEPALDAWARKLPADVNFRRIPVAFAAAQETLQKLYFALEGLGLLDSLHRKVFAAVHVQHLRFDKDADVVGFASANGVDPNRLLDTVKSFAVATKCRQAKQQAEAFRIDGVPTLGIQGRYMTSLSLAGGAEPTLQVVDALIRKSRRG